MSIAKFIKGKVEQGKKSRHQITSERGSEKEG